VISAVGIVHVAGGHVTPNLAAFHWGFAAAAAIAVIAVGFALRINDRDAASTMKKRPDTPVKDDEALVPIAT
jgi:hypothetical protein